MHKYFFFASKKILFCFFNNYDTLYEVDGKLRGLLWFHS